MKEEKTQFPDTPPILVLTFIHLQSVSAHFLGHSSYYDGTKLVELTPKQLAFLARACADAGIRDKPLLLGIATVGFSLTTFFFSDSFLHTFFCVPDECTSVAVNTD
mgnify:CR=1 FL=1